MGYLILGICLFIAAMLAMRAFVNTNPATLAKVIRYSLMGLAVAAGLFLMLTGRFGLGVLLLLASLGFLRRWRLPRLPFPGRGPSPSQGQTSEVETGYLRMVLEHDSGQMRGQVLRGPYAGEDLSQLSLAALVDVLGDCLREDQEGAQLLQTYLERAYGADWREQAAAAGVDLGDEPHSGGRARGGAKSAGEMTNDEARDILGVGPDASEHDIREAHRRLMLKIHPDKGGSSYLAAKINQAKDLLLGV